jgi:protein CpxP
MKPFILVAFIFIGTMSFAQPSKRGRDMSPPMPTMANMSAENIATLMSKKMTLQLDLSKTQQAKVYELILETTVKKRAQRANRPEGKPSKEQHFEMQNKMLDDKIAFNKSMKAILNDVQYTLWKQQTQKKKKKKKKKLKH